MMILINGMFKIIVMFLCMIVITWLDFQVIKYLKRWIAVEKLTIIPKKYAVIVWTVHEFIVYVLMGKKLNLHFIVVYTLTLPLIDYILIKRFS